VTFSNDHPVTWCPFLSPQWEEQNSCPKKDQVISISSIVKNNRDNGLEYFYIPTGGRIIGHGPNVTWDFDNVRPGKYELTVGIGKDYLLFGKTITKTIELKECGQCDPPPCECPTISISGPKLPVQAGSSIIFEAKVLGGEKNSQITYKWAVSKGTVLNGGGRTYILVKTTPDMSGELTVTLEIGGTCVGCPNTDSKTITIFSKKKSN
jgi:hypothetical protein